MCLANPQFRNIEGCKREMQFSYFTATLWSLLLCTKSGQCVLSDINLSYRPLGYNINVLSCLFLFINASFKRYRDLCKLICKLNKMTPLFHLFFFNCCKTIVLFLCLLSSSYIFCRVPFLLIQNKYFFRKFIAASAALRLWKERSILHIQAAQYIGATWHYRTDADLTKCHTLPSINQKSR